MEFSEAAEALKVQNPLGADEVGDKLAQAHAGNPQRELLARRAMTLIREGLAGLASLGHRFDLVEHNPVPVRFPQMLYKASERGTDTRTVESQDEFDAAVKDGWSEAQP